jgi:hypothetical protein
LSAPNESLSTSASAVAFLPEPLLIGDIQLKYSLISSRRGTRMNQDNSNHWTTATDIAGNRQSATCLVEVVDLKRTLSALPPGHQFLSLAPPRKIAHQATGRQHTCECRGFTSNHCRSPPESLQRADAPLR